ncbi:hypothetical protein [Lentzea albida]|uniref:hypothetical protein n=1 Tax=Lentzea albida TaxID=65499 RepID=UPI0011601A07|nr:hypothetical protein [Lentzea albida]
MPTQTILITLAVAGIPAVAAIVSAIFAGRYALRTRRAESDAQRTRELEARLSEKKFNTYEPMINMLSEMLDGRYNASEDAMDPITRMRDFATWIAIFGSDRAVQAYHNWMQAIYSAAPAPILMYLYGEFLVAAREDLGYGATAVQRQHLLGMRIKDIYTFHGIGTLSFKEVCREQKWKPTWQGKKKGLFRRFAG